MYTMLHLSWNRTKQRRRAVHTRGFDGWALGGLALPILTLIRHHSPRPYVSTHELAHSSYDSPNILSISSHMCAGLEPFSCLLSSNRALCRCIGLRFVSQVVSVRMYRRRPFPS